MKNEFKERYRLLGLRIAYFRKKKGLTQEQLAESIEAHPTFLGQVECGIRGISLDNIFKISDELEVSPDKFFKFDD